MSHLPAPNHLADKYYMGNVDPNMAALAQQAFLSLNLGGQPPQFSRLFQIPAMPPVMAMAPNPMIPTMSHAPMPAMNSHPPQFEMSMPSENETIEAGSGSLGSSMRHKDERNSSTGRRRSVSWETMTDDERELVQRQKRKEEAFKTALCDAYKRSAVCPYGTSCRFAHGENELRLPAQPRGKSHPKYKTQLCDKFSTFGQCPYGPRCQFIHKLKKGLPLLEYNRLLEQGNISPARESEITNPEESEYRSQYRSFGRDSDRDSGRRERLNSTGSTRRNLASQLQSERPLSSTQFYRDEPKERIVYPTMKVVNIEKATSMGELNNREGFQRRPSHSPVRMREGPTGRRRSSFSNYRQLAEDDEDCSPARPTNSKSGGHENVRVGGNPHSDAHKKTVEEVTGRGRKKELSLIREEPEESQVAQINDGSSAQQGAPWFEQIFGKKMEAIAEADTYAEESKEDTSMLRETTLEQEMTAESCDEELLAQGRYNFRYPDPPVEMLKSWKAEARMMYH